MSQVGVRIIFGLGNPGAEYDGTRHNVGARVLETFAKQGSKKKVILLPPTTYMNKSGEAIGKLVKSKKAAAGLVVIHDDLDLPLGTFKISFGRGSGGHRGVESIIKKLKTKAFIRLRIGIAPVTPAGKLKKPASPAGRPTGGKAVVDFILGKFKPAETEKLKKVWPKTSAVLETLVTAGREAAMNQFN